MSDDDDFAELARWEIDILEESIEKLGHQLKMMLIQDPRMRRMLLKSGWSRRR